MEAIYKGFKIKANRIGAVESNSVVNGWHWRYKITVINTNNKNTKKAVFTYSSSINDYQTGKTTLTEEDLLFAFYCLMSDAQAGANNFRDFCGDFGYNEDSRNAFKAFKACQKQALRVYELGLIEDDIVAFLNDEVLQ